MKKILFASWVMLIFCSVSCWVRPYESATSVFRGFILQYQNTLWTLFLMLLFYGLRALFSINFDHREDLFTFFKGRSWILYSTSVLSVIILLCTGAAPILVASYAFWGIGLYFLLLWYAYKDEQQYFNPVFHFVFSLASMLVVLFWINGHTYACLMIVAVASILVAYAFLLDRVAYASRWMAKKAYRLKCLISDIVGY